MTDASDPRGTAPTLAPGARDTSPTLAPGATHALAPTLALAPSLSPGATLPLPQTLKPPSTPPSTAPAGNATWMQADAPVAAVPGSDDGLPAPPRPGEIVGDFVVTELLGEGGMGAVFRARQVSLHREVALKVLLAGQVGDEDAIERFMREARSAASLSHPHVVTTFATGRDPATQRLFIAMELVGGGDAERSAVRAGGKLPERRALEVIRDCARGLVAIEAAGLVHRDIKPENIFLTASGTAKLGDLGLARRQSGDDRLTQTGSIVGTPCFMSPEQANGQTNLDIRTDVYALGASLLRLLTGRRPFEGGSVPAILYRVISVPPPDPRASVPSTSPAVCALIARAMAKDRQARHPSAAAFLADLEAALSGAPSPAHGVAPSGVTTLGLPALAAVLLLVALLGLGVAAIALALAR